MGDFHCQSFDTVDSQRAFPITKPGPSRSRVPTDPQPPAHEPAGTTLHHGFHEVAVYSLANTYAAMFFFLPLFFPLFKAVSNSWSCFGFEDSQVYPCWHWRRSSRSSKLDPLEIKPGNGKSPHLQMSPTAKQKKTQLSIYIILYPFIRDFPLPRLRKGYSLSFPCSVLGRRRVQGPLTLLHLYQLSSSACHGWDLPLLPIEIGPAML